MKSTEPATAKATDATDAKAAFDRFTESAKEIVRVTKGEVEREEEKWPSARKARQSRAE